MNGVPGKALSLAWLTLVWVALWGDVALGTVVAGALIGGFTLLALHRFSTRDPSRRPDVRPLALLRYVGTFTVMLVQANIAVAKVVLSPRLRIEPAILAVHLPPTTPFVATLVANSVTLTPGTLTLDAVRNPDESWTLIVHALDAPDMEPVRADTLRLYALASAAFRPDGEEVPS